MRLTKKYLDGSYEVADNLPVGENSHEFKQLLINTLGKYEDIGEVQNLKSQLIEVFSQLIQNEIDNESLNEQNLYYKLGYIRGLKHAKSLTSTNIFKILEGKNGTLDS